MPETGKKLMMKIKNEIKRRGYLWYFLMVRKSIESGMSGVR
jgi:hypothetical protein